MRFDALAANAILVAVIALLISHVTIAVSSIVYTTYIFVRPSKAKLYTAYGLVGLTLASGTYLVIATHSPMLGACETGLLYLAVVMAGIVAAHRRLATAKAKINQRVDN